MGVMLCSSCGSNQFIENREYRICAYCGGKTKKEAPARVEKTIVYQSVPRQQTSATIDLTDDVSRLLQKCKADPRNARKYANLILDIDPDNTEALKYLR